MAGGPWSDEENDLIVRSYLGMRREELAGRSYNKARARRALMTRIDRSEASIEFKHRNISFVMRSAGEAAIKGYLPARNIQSSLIDAVARGLADEPDLIHRSIASSHGAGFGEDPTTWVGKAAEAPLPIGTPPTFSNAPPPPELEESLMIARRLDAAGRAAANKALGRAGEERALASERAALRSAGRDDLARRVRWTSEEEGDGAGFDIESFAPDGSARLLEVKTTNGDWDRTPFFISRNELRTSAQRADAWVLLRIYDFARTPKAFELRPPLDAHVSLLATNYEARFEARD
ncbi:MAG: DUF3883 domain-containing protein [Pseudomonadota bacterium]